MSNSKAEKASQEFKDVLNAFLREYDPEYDARDYQILEGASKLPMKPGGGFAQNSPWADLCAIDDSIESIEIEWDTWNPDMISK